MRNKYIFIQENAFENVVCEMAAILSRALHAQCVENFRVNFASVCFVLQYLQDENP